MKTLFLITSLLFCAILSNAQNYAFGYNFLTGRTDLYVTNSPGNTPGNRSLIGGGKDSSMFFISSPVFRVTSINWNATRQTSIKDVVVPGDSGQLLKGNIYAMLDTNLVVATHSWANARFLTSFTQVNADWNSVSGVSQILNKPTIPTTTSQISEGSNLYYTDARARASNSAGSGIAYNSSTGVITNSAPDQTVSITGSNGLIVSGSYPNFTIRIDTPTISTNVTRPLSPAGSGGTFTVSTTQYATVYYPLTLTVSTPALAGTSTATAFLEFQRPGQSWWNTLPPLSNTQTVTLAVGVNISTPNGVVVGGKIPPNCLVRIRTVVSGSTPGTVTFGVSSIGGTEILSYF